MRRESRGKRLVLSPRDLEIFRALSRYRYLNSEYLHAFVGGGSEKRFKERLGDLFHENFIGRPDRQWDYADSRYRPVFYESGPRTRQILHSLKESPPTPMTFMRGHGHQQFQHSTMICYALAGMEIIARKSAAFELIGWSEILAKAPSALNAAGKPFAIPLSVLGPIGDCDPQPTSLIPDAIFGLRYQDAGSPKYRFFALEVDQGTMPIQRSNPGASSYHRKLLAYQKVMDLRLFKSMWGLPNLMVLTVSAARNHLQHLLEHAAELSSRPSPFLFKTFGEDEAIHPDTAERCLKSPWLGADGRYLDIAKV